jgi:hypothetical protein
MVRQPRAEDGTRIARLPGLLLHLPAVSWDTSILPMHAMRIARERCAATLYEARPEEHDGEAKNQGKHIIAQREVVSLN